MKPRTKFLLPFTALSILMIPLLLSILTSTEPLTIHVIILVVPLGGYLMTSAILYNRFIRNVRPRYPLASPDPEREIYLPRSNIPRPIHADYREYKEKLEDMKKLEKLLRKEDQRRKDGGNKQ